MKPYRAAVYGFLDPALGKAAMKRQRIANCIRIVRPDDPFELNDLQLRLHAVFEPGLEMVQYHYKRVRTRGGHPIEASLAFKPFLCLPATKLTPTLGISCYQSESSFRAN
jgi:hypothetical protein